MSALALSSLAREINIEHEAALFHVRSGFIHARLAGELLLKAKASVPHGAWLPWLAEHCPTISDRSAQGYMQVAKRWPELEAKAQRVADLNLRDALALLAEPKRLAAETERQEAPGVSVAPVDHADPAIKALAKRQLESRKRSDRSTKVVVRTMAVFEGLACGDPFGLVNWAEVDFTFARDWLDALDRAERHVREVRRILKREIDRRGSQHEGQQ